jgi:small subunit ribosomal protein S18
MLRSFTSGQCKIIDPRYSGICAHHQRMLAQAVKRSRILGLLPFVRSR